MKLKKIIVDGQEIELGGSGGGAEAYVEGTALVINNSGTPGTGGSGGGVSSVFEDVDALPDNPDEQKIYRIKAAGTYKIYLFTDVLIDIETLLEQQGTSLNFIVVGSLPDNPKDVMDESSLTFYIMGEDIYGYNADGNNTWLSNNELAIALGFLGYGGFITSTDDTSELTAEYLYLQCVPSTSYSYVNVNGNSQFEFANLPELENNLGVGREGTGKNSEVFNNYDKNVASGKYSHAEGYKTVASGDDSHAEGWSTTASDENAHAEGFNTIASSNASHAEGWSTRAFGKHSHAEGGQTIASGEDSHAEGWNTTASGKHSHAEGFGAVIVNTYTFTRTSTQCQYTSTRMYKIGDVFTDEYHTGENGTYATIKKVLRTEGHYTYTFDKDFVTTEGETVTLYQVVGVAFGDYSHAEGYKTIASGMYAHSEGYNTTASGEDAHAEGNGTVASSYDSHAEGYETEASGSTAHAEGCNTVASGDNSHAEGYKTVASGDDSHAEGYDTKALGTCAHAEGYSTIASSNASHVEGKFNIEDTNKKYAHIVGNGSSTKARSNAHTLDWDGNAWFKGKVRIGGNSWDEGTELGTGGGSSQVFEDVVAIPENPDPQKIYRTNAPQLYMYYTSKLYTLDEAMDLLASIQGQDPNAVSVRIIPATTKPDNPVPFIQEDIETQSGIFNVYVIGNDIYGNAPIDYETGEMAWLQNNDLLDFFGLGLFYGGVVESLDTSTMEPGYVYLHYEYQYINIVNGIENILNGDNSSEGAISNTCVIETGLLFSLISLSLGFGGHENGNPILSASVNVDNVSGSDILKSELQKILSELSSKTTSSVILKNPETLTAIGGFVFNVGAYSATQFELYTLRLDRTNGFFGVTTVWYNGEKNTIEIQDILVDASLHSVYNMNTGDGKTLATKDDINTGGGGTSFVEVNELPENPTTNTIYKLKNPVVFSVTNGVRTNILYALESSSPSNIKFTYEVVDALPETPTPCVVYIYNNNFYTVYDDGQLIDGSTLASGIGYTFKGYTDTLENLEEMCVYIYDNVESYNVYDGKYNTFPTKKYKKILEVSKTFDTEPTKLETGYIYSFDDALTENDFMLLSSYVSQRLNYKCIFKVIDTNDDFNNLYYECHITTPTFYIPESRDQPYYGLSLTGVMSVMGLVSTNICVNIIYSDTGLNLMVLTGGQPIAVGGTLSLELYAEDDI